MPFLPAGTVYGTLLNFPRERALLAEQMHQPPYKAPPQAPVLYVKTANTWSASGSAIEIPAEVPALEVGASILMVITRSASVSRRFPAIDLVASYVLVNDVSIPHTSFFRPPVKFKNRDGFLGLGANAVPAGALPDPRQCSLEVRINGALVQTISFANTVRNAAQLLADVGEFMTLQDGDCLLLGCDCLPEGGRPLARVGDRVDICASDAALGFGVLTHTFVAEAV